MSRPTEGRGVTEAGAGRDQRYLATALALIVSFMAFEVAMAAVSGSLALLADAAHMLTDAFALAASVVAARLVTRPAGGAWTFGLKRSEILSAAGNGLTLVLAAGLITYEAILRLLQPPPVEGAVLLGVALVGVAVNLVATWVLAKADRQSMNVAGSFAHILTDLYAFLGSAAAGAIIYATGWRSADPLASLLVAGLMVKAALPLLRRSGRVLLEAAPEGLDPGPIAQEIADLPEVAQVHDLHLWLITSGFPALAAHVLVRPDSDCHGTRRRIEVMLSDRHGIGHTTLQVDHQATSDLPSEVALPPPTRRAADRYPKRGQAAS
ncbi:MAG: cation diffusion facilitator family transporter [Acidimicrobiales bacterium]